MMILLLERSCGSDCRKRSSRCSSSAPG